MEKRILNYLKFLEKLEIDTLDDKDLQMLKEEVPYPIALFQHERLIHLIVTVTFASLTVAGLLGACFSGELLLAVLTMLFLILLIPYIRHYFILENSVQKMYTYYDKINAALYGRKNTVFMNERV
ncbi:MAG: hypothetical protein IJ805_06570 [Lachnospiraceae bacterium]|nr:hypothetical protein [Lachnospiraceae bacterium]